MALRIAVTGDPGSGKSTLVCRVAEALGAGVGGLITAERRVEGRRTGFCLRDLQSGAEGTLASLEGQGPRLGRYHVNLEDLEAVGARAVEEALGCDLIVIDEVGPMELFSPGFASAVGKALASDRPMLVVLHKRSRHPLAERIREEFRVVEVTRENRDGLLGSILAELKGDIG